MSRQTPRRRHERAAEAAEPSGGQFRPAGRYRQSYRHTFHSELSVFRSVSRSFPHLFREALNATAAVQRVQPDADTSTGLVTQVLNPASSHSGKASNRRSDRTLPHSGLFLLCVVKIRLSVTVCLTGWWKSSRRDVPDTQPDASGRSSGSQSSLELLQGMLGQVEAELDGLGTPDTTGGSELRCARGLTGFSAALVSALGRVASHLRQVSQTRGLGTGGELGTSVEVLPKF